MPDYDIDEAIDAELRYTEETGRAQHSLSVRDCWLWQVGVEQPISGLNVVSFRQRFGAVAVPAEGIGGVETTPAFRRRGAVSKVLARAIAGIAKRVPVVFISDAIEELYEKFGAVTCLAEGYLLVPVRNVERMASSYRPAVPGNLRRFTPDDLPAMVSLYNTVHAHRPWTHERHTGWNQLSATQTWQPGSEVVVFEREAQLAGYAILKEPQFGHTLAHFTVDELTARDAKAAQALLIEIASRCWQRRLSEFSVREPLDSTVGAAARQLGCSYQQTFPPSGGMMGLILERQQLLEMLEPELRRRLATDDLLGAHTPAFDALYRGDLIADNQVLLRLLLGYWSAADARAQGALMAAAYDRVYDAWFPGGGTHVLPQPYAHTLDRY